MFIQIFNAHFSTLGQSISGELGPREVGRASEGCLYMALAWQGSVLTYICRCMGRPVLTVTMVL